jgi:hypothetical protein
LRDHGTGAQASVFLSETRRKATSCEQKVAKNFTNRGSAGFTGTGPVKRKILHRYFQKATAVLPSLAPTGKTSYINGK